MTEKINLKHEVGRGISPQQFMDGMHTLTMELSNIPDTKAQFLQNYDHFNWHHQSDERFFSELTQKSGIHCLILGTDWCPDVIWNVPVLFRVMEQAGIATEVLPMEEHPDTVDLFLIDGGRAQPIALLVNGAGDVVGKWGPRPAYIQAVMDQFKRDHPDRQSPEYKEHISYVYRKIGALYHDVARYQDAMIAELRALLTDFA
ncbi:thioredoxin family protein [Alicyclobacillus sp. ALC3]|uniref:thioredoxin family protein n=1 Tax=Alicyclobacillus sp. ALC3 TaxID=2796143 RepID=UPI00237881DE|nr:thioredoxin family protein [Alicyclobacillus sp. ALC3]WDL99216.1 thioredoxin family protein [Alicyclobacillus sp. ALC3]